MAKFEIEGKEYELIFKTKALFEIEKEDIGPFELMGEIMQGKASSFITLTYLCLLHTGQGFTKEKIKKEIGEKVESEKMDLDYIMSTGYEVVSNDFFFKKTFKKMKKADPEGIKMMDMIAAK